VTFVYFVKLLQLKQPRISNA